MGLPTWTLEVIRGKTIGQSFPIAGVEIVLGAHLRSEQGIDLADQEGDSPRRMAPRQALIATTDRGLFLRDLDSPGGTFVNRQRLLPEQSRPLQSGDVIQVGSIQLRVVEKSASVGSPRQVNSFAYKLAEGTVCHTWDDFLRVASQKWADLRNELDTGRIDSWLRSIGREDLLTSKQVDLSSDERLDSWLGGLPATYSAQAELDVHPSRLIIQVTPGGGTISRSVQVANVGYRLLRITARIEPSDTNWIRVRDAISNKAQTVIDCVQLPLEISIPNSLPRPLTATLLVEGNGGSRTVEVLLKAKDLARSSIADRALLTHDEFGFKEWVSQTPTSKRLIVLGLAGLFLRLVVGLSNQWIGSANPGVAHTEKPALFAATFVFASIAALLALGIAIRRKRVSQSLFGLISGGAVGAAGAAIIVAMCRAIEPALGGLASSYVAVGLLWALIGVGLAVLSTVLIPYKVKPTGGTST